MNEPQRVVFLCVANSARSQMAEGLARAMAPATAEVFSAGSQPSVVHPWAVRVMAEIGIDIGDHRSKGMDDVPLETADVIVTLCAEEVCPVTPPHVRRLAWPIPDPATAGTTDEERHTAFRAARDDIRGRLTALWPGATLPQSS